MPNIRLPQQRMGKVGKETGNISSRDVQAAKKGMPKDPAAPKRGSSAIEPYKQFKKRTGTTLPNQGKGKKAK